MIHQNIPLMPIAKNIFAEKPESSKFPFHFELEKLKALERPALFIANLNLHRSRPLPKYEWHNA